jgi:hypothetical protein
MYKYEVKKHTYNEGMPLGIYISIQTSTINPLELEKEVDEFISYMRDKYKTKTYNKSWFERVKEIFKL